MNCAEFESKLADYIDGSLESSERAAVESHAANCANCRELMADALEGMNLLERALAVEAPPELVTRIAYQTPIGRLRDAFDKPSVWSRFTSKWLQPILQPRLAMGMAMTILSFAMLERCAGIRVQHLQAADLNPVRVWTTLEDNALRWKDRAVNYYENLRFVYAVEMQLKELLDEREAAQEQAQRAKRTSAKPQTGSNPSNMAPGQPEEPKGKRK